MDWGNCVQGPQQVATLNCLPTVFKVLINAALVLAGTTALIFIVIAGIKYINSGGDPKGVEGARKTLTWAIIGLLIVLFAFAIINFISVFTGVSCIKGLGFQNCG